MTKSLFFIFSISLFCINESLGQEKVKYFKSKNPIFTKVERKTIRQELSVKDGPYLLFQGGLRQQKTSQSNDFFTGGYGEYNGIARGAYGYRINNTSFEVGIGFIWHGSKNFHDMNETGKQMATYSNFNSVFLPVGLKYDIPTGPKKKFRLGANASMNILLVQSRKPRPTNSGFYYFDIRKPNDVVDYSYKIENKGVTGFLKIGFYTEFQIFKSSFLLFQVSKVISPSPQRTLSYKWKYEGQSGSFVDEVRIDGLLFELAYKLPLNIFHLEKRIQ